MSSVFNSNTASDDGLGLQRVVRHGLITMVVAIIILSGSALWTVIQLTGFYQNEVNIVAEQERLLHAMRVVAKERTLLMYAMITEEDPFLKDDQRMAFYSAGTKFAIARIELLKTPLIDNEKYLLEKQGKETGLMRSHQDQVLDLVLEDNEESAIATLRRAVSGQQRVMKILDQLNVSVDSRYKEITTKADTVGQASIVILFTIVIIIIAGAVYIIRQTTHRASSLISQLFEARVDLQNANDELMQQQDTLDHHAIVSIADRFGNITYINEKFCEISGYSRDELIGRNHRILKSEEHSTEFYQDLWQTISQGNVWQGEICNRRKDGTHYWVESTISPFVDKTGKPYKYVSIRTDITHLLDAKIEAEKANHAKSVFLSSMSHELRTPMNAVLGFSQLLEAQLEGEQLESVKTITNAGKHLMVLIDEVLDLSQIESEHLDLAFESVDVETLVNECLEWVGNSAHTKNIILQQKISAPSDMCVIADRTRLKQAILNYLSNAIKYTQQNGKVVVRVKPSDTNMCRIIVEDTGPGLNQEQCSIVFNPFTRLDEHINATSGTGIGLAITKRIIEMMKGKVGVDSEVGKGSEFWLEVPVISEKN